MFTIKVVERDGEGMIAEHVFEASGVRRDASGVHVDLESGMATYGTAPGSADASSVEHRMYVMNRFGATVADYRL